MRRCAILLGSLCLLCAGGTSHAHQSSEPGMFTFGFSAIWLTPPRPGTPGTFLVWLNEEYPNGARAEVHVHLPAGVSLVSGDTLVVGTPDDDKALRWRIVVLCKDSTLSWITGDMRMDRGRGVFDEAEFELRCSTIPDSLPSVWSRSVREETIRGNQRYRFGGLFLVPIDGPQRVTELDLLLPGGARAEVLRTSRLRVASMPKLLGGGERPDTISFGAFVKPNGRARGIEFWGMQRSPQVATLRSAIEKEVVAHWRFKPARFHGVPVDDWVLVRAPVRVRR
jgi:hypothetical protein